MIKAVFLDIDGTIISIKKHSVPQSALFAIRKARQMGVKIFLCTSRAWQLMGNVSIENDGKICLTGAHSIDASGKTIDSRPMDSGDVANAILDCQIHGRPLVGLAADKFYLEHPESDEVTGALATGGLTRNDILGEVCSFPDLRGDADPARTAEKLGILQLTGFFPSGKEDERFLSLMPSSHSERWTEPFVDIVGNGTSKAHGIDVMCAHFGFSLEETMAMGDGNNDIPMLLHAGIGVGMGNGSDKVKSAADFVTADVDEDGLSLAFEKFVF